MDSAQCVCVCFCLYVCVCVYKNKKAEEGLVIWENKGHQQEEGGRVGG